MWANGRPRYWLGAYDAWHLLLPVAFIGVLAWAWTLPPVPVPVEPVRPAPPPMAQAAIESPVNGAQFRASRIGDVEGHAQPGSVVVLQFAPAQQAWRELGRAEVGADGRFRFRLAGFAPGLYALKAAAWTRDGRVSESPAVDLWVVADPRPATPAPARKRRTR